MPPKKAPARRDPYGLEPAPLTPDEIDYIVSIFPATTFRETDEDIARVKALRAKVGDMVLAEAVVVAFKNTKKADPRGFPLATETSPVSFAEIAKGAFQTTIRTMLAQMMQHLRSQLVGFSLAPILLDPLREAVRHYFDKSKVQSGDTVGVLAAEALGGPVQQMALNSFHASGTARNIAGGVDGIRELINLTKKRSQPSCTIHFTKPPTFVEAIRKEADWVGVSVGQLVKERPMILSTRMFTPEAWYDLYALVYQITPPPAEWFLRLTFDTQRLLAHRITLNDIVRTIEKIAVVKCIASPSHIGIVDVYPVKRAILLALEADAKKGKKKGSLAKLGDVYGEVNEGGGEDEDEGADKAEENENEDENEREKEALAAAALVNEATKKKGKPFTPRVTTTDPLNSIPLFETAEGETDDGDFNTLMFLNAHIIPLLDKMNVRGVVGIKAIFPVMLPVWSVVDAERYDDTTGLWNVYLNPRRMRIKGITLEEMQRVLALTDQPTEVQDETHLRVAGKKDLRPGQVILDAVEKERKAYEEALDTHHAKEKDSTHLMHRLPRDTYALLDASTHIVCDTNGTNLRGLLARRDVDPTRTVSNNVHEIAQVFGIGAARAFLIDEFFASIEHAGSYVQPSHLMLLVDFMTVRGRPLSVSFSALAKRDTHTLALATNQQSMKVFANAAVMGKKEAVKGVSAGVLTNRRGVYGTGAIEVFTKPGYQAKWDSEKEAIATAAAELSQATTLEQRGPGTAFEVGGSRRQERERAPRVRLTAEQVLQSMDMIGSGGGSSQGEQEDLEQANLLDEMFGAPEPVPQPVPQPVAPSVTRLDVEAAGALLASQPIQLDIKPPALINPTLRAIASSTRIPAVQIPDNQPAQPAPGELITPAPRKRVRLGQVFADMPIDLEAALNNPIHL